MKRPMLITCLVIVGLCLCITAAGQTLISTRGHTNPPVVSEPAWDSSETRQLAKRACFDCHSNETTWPWFTNVPPLSLLVLNDVREGRDHLNFSNWQSGGGRNRETREIPEVVMEGSMPPLLYLTMHPEARLTPEEKAALARGLEQTLTNP